MIRRLEGVARAIAVGFWFMTATFSWLVSVPFAYRNFIQPRLLPDLVEFAEKHGHRASFCCRLGGPRSGRRWRHPRSRGQARGVLRLWAVAAARPPLYSKPGARAARRPCPRRVRGGAYVSARVGDRGPLGAEPMAETAGADRTSLDSVAVMLATGLVFGVSGPQAVGRGHVSAAGLGASAITHLLAAAAIFLSLTILEPGRTPRAAGLRGVLADASGRVMDSGRA